ncbi:MAG: serine proteinase [Oscillospiraceae bacterium]|jgi:hypothetical protein
MDFEALKSKVTEMAQSGVSKAKEMVEIGKLKVNNATEADAIRKAYAEIGKLYFAQHGMDPEPAYAALCAKIVESKERIAYNDERITDIKSAANLADADIAAMDAELSLDDPDDDLEL